jgi:hypothetical protein
MDNDSYLARHTAEEFAQILMQAVPYRFMTEEEEAEADSDSHYEEEADD